MKKLLNILTIVISLLAVIAGTILVIIGCQNQLSNSAQLGFGLFFGGVDFYLLCQAVKYIKKSLS